MSFSRLLAFVLFNWSVANPILKRQAPTFVYDGDAPFSVDAETLAAAITCPNGNPTSAKPPVFLVHGKIAHSSDRFALKTPLTFPFQGQAQLGKKPGVKATYQRCLPKAIRLAMSLCVSGKAHTSRPCLISSIAGRAMGDMQVSSEYVAYGIHYVSYLAGGLSTAIISHSQGGPDTQWALQFWPSTRSITTMFIPLSPDFSGILLLDSDLSEICVDDLCQACIWQQSNGSNYYAALHYKDFQALVPTTAIWTEFDGVVEPPQQNAALPGGTAIEVQSLCPLRPVTHITMPIDAAAWALAYDALQHGGTGSLSRVQPDALEICLSVTGPDMDVTVSAQLEADWDDVVDGFMYVSSHGPIVFDGCGTDG